MPGVRAIWQARRSGIGRTAGMAALIAVLVMGSLTACTPQSSTQSGHSPTALPPESHPNAVVQTTEGPVAGKQQDKMQVFRSIPYAAPPVGDRRFMPPADHEPWTEPLHATDPGSACVQPDYYDPTDPDRDVQSEDCLTLNVWTPHADDQKRPVMMWIHGGAFVGGSCRNPWYDGSALASRGNTVVVCLQYWLGVFGFSELSHHDKKFAGGGNAAILDMIAALKWVQRNIAGFGGDPGNVTVFGESAGGEAIHLLMGMPQAQGLFHKAIIQSGILSGSTAPITDSQQQTDEMMKAAGADTVQELQQVPAQDLQRLSDEAGVFQWPHLDGVTVTESTEDVIRAGKGAHVALLIGTNLDEIRYWTALNAAPGDDTVTAEAMQRSVFDNEDMMQQYFGPHADQVIATYRRIYGTPYEDVVNFLSDGNFRIAAIRLAGEQAKLAPSFMYQFTYRSPVKGRTGQEIGASHSMELPFVFGCQASVVQDVTGPASGWGDLQDRTMDAWLAFARNGDPSTETLAWPRYDAQRRATMILGPTSEVVDDPHADERKAWEDTSFDLLPYPIPFEV
jgi:para-nitrobenzyl esterase